MQEEEFQRVFRHSPIRRTKLAGMRRNAILAMGNSGNSSFKPLLARLSGDADAQLAQHAQWALQRLNSPDQTSQPAEAERLEKVRD